MADQRFRTVCLCLLGVWGVVVQVRAEYTLSMLQTSPVTAERGSNLVLSCKVNAGLPIILSHVIRWQKESRVPEVSNGTLLISEQQRLLVKDQQAARYGVTVDSSSDSITVELRIRNVTDSDDGRYTCLLETIKGSVEVARNETEVIVPNAADRLILKVDEKVPGGTIKMTPGSHSVQCIFEGINPESQKLRISLGGQPLYPGDITSSIMPLASSSAGAPRYRVQAKVELDVTQTESGKTLSCTPGITPRSVSTTFHVVPKPSVDCDDVKVRRSDTHVQLVCVVTHADVTIDEDDFELELADSGIIYSTEDPAHNNTFVTQELTDAETKVSQRLDVAKWSDQPTRFKLTVSTEVGRVSDDGFVYVVPDEEKEPADDNDDQEEKDPDGDKGDDGAGDDGEGDENGEDGDKTEANKNNTNGTSCSLAVSKLIWSHALLLVLILFLQA